MKLLALISHGYAFALNAYFLMTLPLIAASAYLSIRNIGLSKMSAPAGNLLFAFLPYHFMRGLPHFFLAAYFMIPPLVMVTLWIYGDRPPCITSGASRYRRESRPSS